jgi:hypothetical protein
MDPTASSKGVSRRTVRGMSARRVTAIFALGALALGASACGSSSSSGTTTAPGGSTTATSTPGSTSVTTTTKPASSKSALAAIASKLGSGQSATFLADYRISGTESGKAVNGTFEIAHSGTNSLFSFDESASQFEEIGSGSKGTVCAKTSGHWTCYSGAGAAAIGASVKDFENLYGSKAELTELKAEESGAYDVSSSTETIGGQSATCATFKTHTSNGSYTVCITAQGEMAEVRGTTTTGTFTLTLSSYSTSVPSSAFTLPATPTTIP